MSKSHVKPVALAACAAVGLSLSAGAFASQALAGGYMAAAGADHHAKAGEGKCGVANLDTDKDGRVSRTEFTAAHPDKAEKFATIDSNGDGFIDDAEHTAHKAAHAGDGKGDAKAMGEGKCGEGKCGGSV